MSSHLPPVTVAAALFGGIEALARIAGNQPKSGYGWRHPSMNHDAGDFRSARHIRAVHSHAQRHGIPLPLGYLIYGVNEGELQCFMDENKAAIDAMIQAQLCACPVHVEAAE